MSAQRHSVYGIAWCLAVLLSGCGGSAPAPSSVPPKKPSHAPLVVSIVIDQLGSWALERYLPYLHENGLIKRIVSQGAFYEHSQYSYAGTFTAPGHATIYTGRLPRDHGVYANRAWHPELGQWLSIVDDQTHHIHGTHDEFAGPNVLRVPTVGDLLKTSSQNQAKVVSVSLKPWPAIASGGKQADLVAWYNLTGEMTTSTFYASSLPEWIAAWNREHPVTQYMGVWSVDDPTLLERLVGNDVKPGESPYYGWTTAFPHDPRMSTSPNEAFLLTPQSVSYLLDFSRAVVSHYHMGEDAVADLLMVSVSTTDKIGHAFGNESWEYVDNLIRTDHMLGTFIKELEQRFPVAVVVTSDHGAEPIPEQSTKASATRIKSKEFLSTITRVANHHLGEGQWIAPLDGTYVVFGPSVKTPAQQHTLVTEIQKTLKKDKRIWAVYDLDTLKTAKEPSDAIEAAVWRSTPSDINASLYIVPAENVLFRLDAGTTHGSPWRYDREVPVLIQAPGITTSRHTNPVDQIRVAATLADLLGIAPPQPTVPSLLQ